MMYEIISDLTTIDFILLRLRVEPAIRLSSIDEGIEDTEDLIAVLAVNKVLLGSCAWMVTIFLLGMVHRGEKPSPRKATDNSTQITNFSRGIVEETPLKRIRRFLVKISDSVVDEISN